MNVIDSEGRLFGRVNLFDAAIGAFVVLLVPLTYAAVLLFRPPTPRITSVEPAPLTMTEDRAAGGSQLSGKLKVRGTGLRPVLRAEIGGNPTLGYIFESPSSADVLHGDLPAGVHDLVLYDGVQEVARAIKAVTIAEKPVAGFGRVHAVGTFLDLDQEASRRLRVGAAFPDANDPRMQIVTLAEPEPARYLVNGKTPVSVNGRWQRDAVVAIRCELGLLQPAECRETGVIIAQGHVISLPGSAGNLRLQIAELVPETRPEMTELRIRFLGYPSVLDLVKVGDRDRAELALDGRGAVIASAGARRVVPGQVSVGLNPDGLAVNAGVEAGDQVGALDAVVRLGLDRSPSAVRYRSDIVRVGATLTFSTPTYTIRGVVLAMRPETPPAGAEDTR